MKGWAVAVGVLAVGGSLVGAAALGMRAQANAESASSALVLAERASLDRVKAAASAARPPEVTEKLPSSPAPAEPAKPPPTALGFRQTSTYNGAPVYVPENCSGPYDVVLHFHGVHTLVRDKLQSAGTEAVLAVFNAGNGAEKYAQAYQAGGTLDSLLRQIEMAVAPLCPGADAKPRRVALLGFSAGYAAVEKLLSRPEDRRRVDAALLADGLHAGFMDPHKRQMAPNALQAFRDFGELAKQGNKLFAITHSSIMTDGYASTTECSRLLLQVLGVPTEGELVSGKAGGFSVEGFAGNDKTAHVVQFRQMDATLLGKLRARWSR
jgi:type II secretory pathway pseudopilin PulG